MKTLTTVETLFEEATRLASEFVSGHSDRTQPVIRRLEPDELRRALDLEIPREGRGVEGVLDLARKTLEYSVRTGHPRFFNQLFGGHDAAGILGEWITALTNTSMYTYEAAPVGTVVEFALLDRLLEYVGFEEGEGVFSPGGSISNLMCVLAARHRAFPHVKAEGLRTEDRPVIFVSKEAHYSLARAGVVVGIGLAGTVEVAVDSVGRMRPDALELAIKKEQDRGRTPFFVGATAGTTVAGAFDPLNAIADITERHGLWLHIDGSYGGSVLFSDKHRALLDGVQRANSVSWNPHKLMGVPLASAATLIREKGTLVATNGMHAEYLFHEDAESTLDLGDRSLQCGRRVDALKLWFSWQSVGDAGYEKRIDGLFQLAEDFRDLVRARAGFELIREQEGTNVCFRYLPESGRHTTGAERLRIEHETTVRVREAMAREGSFLINCAAVDGAATLRLVASNPETTLEDLEALLERVVTHGEAGDSQL